MQLPQCLRGRASVRSVEVGEFDSQLRHTKGGHILLITHGTELGVLRVILYTEVPKFMAKMLKNLTYISSHVLYDFICFKMDNNRQSIILSKPVSELEGHDSSLVLLVTGLA